MNDKDPTDEEQLAKQLERMHERIIGESTAHLPDGTSQVTPVTDAKALLQLIHMVKQESPGNELRQADAATLGVFEQSTRNPVANPELTGNDKLEEFLPSSIGRFEIRESIGQGGFGNVLRAYDPHLDREVAIKIPKLSSLISTEAKERFVNEAKASASLSHPQIVTVYETGSLGPICFLANELIEGPTLSQWLQERDRPMSTFYSVELARNLADALQHAHDRGVIHRDIKPSNILLAVPGGDIDENQIAEVAKISDFGLAKLVDSDQLNTQSGSIVGTPAYMPPEQTRSDKASNSPASDIYSLGILLYELLTGRTPFAGETLVETITAIQTKEPVAPSKYNRLVSRDLDAIVLKCIEKQPQDRYGSAFELGRDLTRLNAGYPVSARLVGKVELVRRWAKQNPVLALVSSSLFVSLFVGLISVTWLWLSASSHYHLASQREAQLSVKAEELTSAIDQLFFSMATSEELQNESAEGLRKVLLVEANRFYEKFLLEAPDDNKLKIQYARSLVRLGEIFFLLGDLNAATKAGEQGVDQISMLDDSDLSNEEKGEWYVFLGRCHSHAGRTVEADKSFARALQLIEMETDSETAIQSLPARATVLAFRAEFYLLENRISDAQKIAKEIESIWQLIENASALRPHLFANRFYDEAVGQYVIAECLRQEGKAAEAEKKYSLSLLTFERLLKRMPNSVGIAYRMGRCHWGLGVVCAHQGAFDVAREHYLAGLEIMQPLSERHPLVETYRSLTSHLLYSLAATEMSVQNYEEVEKHVVAGIDSDLEMLDDFPDLSAKLNQSIGNSYNLLFAALDQWGERTDKQAQDALVKAMHYLGLAIEERPRWTAPQMALARAESNMGNVHHRNEEFKEAAVWYEKALARNDALLKDEPDWSEVLQSNANVLINLIVNHQSLTNYEKSMEFCDRFTSRFPKHPLFDQVVLQKIYLLAQNQRPDIAIEKLKQFVEDLKTEPGLFVSAAAIAAKIGKLDSVTENQEVVDDLDELTLDILVRGLPQDSTVAEKYLQEIRQNPDLKSYADQVRSR